MGDVLAGEDVLGGLVLDQTTVGLVHCHLGEYQMLIQRRHGGLGDDMVDLLLVELFEFDESLLALGHECVHFSFSCGELFFRSRLRCAVLSLCHCRILL